MISAGGYQICPEKAYIGIFRPLKRADCWCLDRVVVERICECVFGIEML